MIWRQKENVKLEYDVAMGNDLPWTVPGADFYGSALVDQAGEAGQVDEWDEGHEADEARMLILL